MLKPHERNLLLPNLRPPEGYDLSDAIGTSFSLDLLSLLTIPMGIAFSSLYGGEDKEKPDPLALFEALRRYADKIMLFCQKGYISIPANLERLYIYLEKNTFQVQLDKGIFHPKVWILRFNSKINDNVCYRFLCSSRNVTGDRSWDTIIALDGKVIERRNAISISTPLADFIRNLPKITVDKLPDEKKKTISKIQDELRRTRFEAPEGIESIAFWPLGMKSFQKDPFNTRIDRLLIMAPFIDTDFFKRFEKNGDNNVLISRIESLSPIPKKDLSGFGKLYYFDAEAATEESKNSADEKSDDHTLEGLHAKLFLIEGGWDVRILSGSANATQAAFEDNIEFLVELKAKKSQFGIDQLIEDKEKPIVVEFADLIHEYLPLDNPKTDIEKIKLEKALRETRLQIAKSDIKACFLALEEGKILNVRLSFLLNEHVINPPYAIQIKCWPITLNESYAQRIIVDQTVEVAFEIPSIDFLTTFYAFEIGFIEEKGVTPARFVLNIPLEGAPSDRKERILLSIIDNQEKLARYLYFLLFEDDDEVDQNGWDSSCGRISEESDKELNKYSAAIFEALLKALYKNPEKLDRVENLIQELRAAKENERLFPKDFDIIWKPIWQARQEIEYAKKQ